LAPNSWQQRTTHTLRLVLSDPDHRPHLIAGLVVCAAAAVVIFFAGRSPVAGTGPLGQATNSLSAESQAPGRRSLADEAPAVGSPRSGPAVVNEIEQPTADPAAGDPLDEVAERVDPESPLRGEELAPGLVVPPRGALPPGAQPPGAPARDTGRSGAAATSPGPNAPAATSAEASAVPPGSDARAPALKPSGKKPGEPAPPQRGGDFDFGI